MTGVRICPFVIMTAWFASMAQPAEVSSLRVVPGDATVWTNQRSQRFLVLARFTDGMERDVTAAARISLTTASVGAMEGPDTFVAKANGDTRLTAQFKGRSAYAQIHVQNAGEKRAFNFATDIGAILTKRGCNQSDCHGGVKGRGGLKLSVSAQFPRDDYQWIVEGGTFQVLTADAGVRVPRVNVKEPEKSLLLLKPTLQIAHGGGERFRVGSADYQTILRWVQAGAPYGAGAASTDLAIQRVDVFPAEVVLDAGGRHQLLVTAHYLNGRTEDITSQVLYVSNDPSIVEVGENGAIQAKQAGAAAILIRAPGHVASVAVGVIRKPVEVYPVIEARSYIDRLVLSKLQKFNIVPSRLAGDEEFLRRVCLDLAGTLPPPERAREFLRDKNPRKRDLLIEQLLGSPEYIDFWSYRLGDLLRVNYNTLQNLAMTKAYEDWIVHGIASNKPYDQMARERIAAQGYSAPSRNFYYIAEIAKPEVAMPELVRVFWGRRIECAQCHNHPFESWTQDQFWNLSAFFAGVTEVQDSRLIIDTLGGGHVDQPRDMMLTHPRTKSKVLPAFLDGRKLPKDEWMDPRAKLAEYMTSHPYFAEATVNRVWGFFFGAGIVEPVDDFRSTNPPRHPELLAALAKDFRESGYDLKRLMRTIVQSRTYQSSSVPNETNGDDRIYFSHAQSRPLEAAVLLDAISSVTGVPEDFRFHPVASGEPPPGARAVQLLPEFTPSQFLDAYGRSMRDALPAGHPGPNLPQALHGLAGATYTSKISHQGGRLAALLERGATDEEIVEEFYMAALTRLPEPEEKAELLRLIRARGGRSAEEMGRLVWALVSSREFATNH